MLRFCVATWAGLELSTDFTVMLNVPAAVGFPLIVFAVSINPPGSTPDEIDHV